ncbi:MAG: cbb3-type cytochrome c oxidase subunit 3 [Alphaproteobacteria bacterium]
MTYKDISQFAQGWGLIYFVILFAVVLLYTFWPRNKVTFDRAARLPLEEDET